MAAGYQKPLVLVYQEFERVSPSLGNPDLAPCIIGPCYNILTLEDDKDIIRAGFFEFDVNANVVIPLTAVPYLDSTDLRITGDTTDVAKTPAYIVTFNDIIDFEDQYDLISLTDMRLTMTYGDPSFATETQEKALDTGDVLIAKLVVPPQKLVTTYSIGALTAGTLDVDTAPTASTVTMTTAAGPVNFETLGVIAGDTVEIAGVAQTFSVTATVVSGTTLTFDNTIDIVTKDDGGATVYAIGNQANFGDDAADDYQTKPITFFAPQYLDVTAPATSFLRQLGTNFETLGVTANDIIVFNSDDDAGNTVGLDKITVTAVDGDKITFHSVTTPFNQADGTAYTALIDQNFLTNALNYKDGYFYIIRTGTNSAAKNSIVFQSTVAFPQEIVDGADDAYTSATFSNFPSNMEDGNFLIWNSDGAFVVEPTVFPIPNPDALPGLELVVASTKVYFDEAVLITAGGIAEVQGALNFIPPTNIVNGAFESNVSVDNLTFIDSVTVGGPYNGAVEVIPVDDGDLYNTDWTYFFDDSALAGEYDTLTATAATTITATSLVGNYVATTAIPLLISSGGYDEITHKTINFESLGVLPGDTFYADFGNGTAYSYVISEVNGRSITVGSFDSELHPTLTDFSFPGFLKADGTVYNTVDGPSAFIDDLLAGGGWFSVYRGNWSTIAVTTKPAHYVIDADESSLLTFTTQGKPTAGDLGFLAPHINIEPGDTVYIGRTTTGENLDINKTFQKHVVLDIRQDRLILTSPVQLPEADRSTATNAATIRDSLAFYVEKRGIDDVLLPISGYDEDADDYTITLNTGSATLDPRFSPLIGGFATQPASGTYTTIDDQGNVTTDNTIKGHVLEGICYIGSSSLRTDLTERLLTFFGTNEIEGQLGKIIPANPLAFGVFKCSQNTVNVGVTAYAIDEATVNTNAEAVAYQKALDYLREQRVYGLVPLTRTTNILGAFKQHVEQMSVPEKGLWRICFINQELPTKTLLLDKHGSVSSLDTVVTIVDLGTQDHRRFKDANAKFVSSGIAPGMNLELFYDNEGAATPQIFIIDAVNSETILTLTSAMLREDGEPYSTGNRSPDDSGTTPGTMNYEITRTLSKTEQAQNIAATSKSYGTRRVISIWPDTIEVAKEEIPGYYLGCVVAGMVAGLPAHQGFTRLGVGGVDSLVHSKGYFNEVQLDIIAGGGTYVFLQDAPNAQPYSRHQLTTDRTFIEVQELNIVKNFDFMSYFFKDLLEPFIGVWNVTDETISAISRTLRSGIAFQENRRFPKIGAALRPGLSNIRTIQESEISSDRIEIFMELALPRPLNYIDLHLIV